jgi:hypothetical protein
MLDQRRPAAPLTTDTASDGSNARAAATRTKPNNQALSDNAVPSRAPRARSTEQETQVNVGVSRRV